MLYGQRSATAAAAADECGQCHVVSSRRKLNTNLFSYIVINRNTAVTYFVNDTIRDAILTCARKPT